VKLGVVFPQTEIGPSPAGVRRYAEHVEEAGFDHIATYDHVLGASSDRPNWAGYYDLEDQFHEVMVMFGYMAAITSRVELATEILVLPQRQAALVAKQAAEVDLLSGGRLRLGVGIGWNAVEYEALGMNFHDRGRRIEEQVALMRELWTKPVVEFQGGHHVVDRAGLNPFPDRRIPIWLGTTADAGLRRAARIADGWQSELELGPQLERNLQALRGYLRENGRDESTFGISGEVGAPSADDVDQAVAEITAWAALGATHVSLTTMGYGFTTLHDHLGALTAVKRAWDRRKVDRG
jgi:probable F420-dependent oxidoreductase